VLEKAKKYVLSTMTPAGYLGAGGRMYAHGLTTLALVEMYGMDPDPELEEKVRKAVDLILKSQGPGGGWNYEPNPVDGDLSVSVMQIVAMRAANNAEMPVPAEKIDKAINYVRAKAHPAGGFGYTSPTQGPHTTAAGILSMQLLGKYDDPTVAKALEYIATLKDSTIKWDAPGLYYFYLHYYAIQANYQAGGKYWDAWHPLIREVLLGKQNADGSWDVPPNSSEKASVDPNRVYSTAMACVILDIYMHFLPAYQR
jgi:hypothetical protein